MGMMDELVQYFCTRGDVAAVYRLPAAHRHPAAGPPSLDLGVLFHPLVDGSRYEELRRIITEEIAVELNRADINVVTLNGISPSLGYDLTQRGGPIYSLNWHHPHRLCQRYSNLIILNQTGGFVLIILVEN